MTYCHLFRLHGNRQCTIGLWQLACVCLKIELKPAFHCVIKQNTPSVKLMQIISKIEKSHREISFKEFLKYARAPLFFFWCFLLIINVIVMFHLYDYLNFDKEYQFHRGNTSPHGVETCLKEWVLQLCLLNKYRKWCTHTCGFKACEEAAFFTRSFQVVFSHRDKSMSQIRWS